MAISIFQKVEKKGYLHILKMEKKRAISTPDFPEIYKSSRKHLRNMSKTIFCVCIIKL